MTTAAPNFKPSQIDDDKNDWKVNIAANGLPYYYNLKTRKSQWDKPESLKSLEEKLNSTDWQEVTTADGKTFYYNAKLKKSVWKMPPELKAVKEKQAEQRKLMIARGELKASGGIKINLSFGNNSLGLADNDYPEEQPTPKSKKPEGISKEEANKIFMDLLKEKANPTLKWDQAHQLLMNDDRYKVIQSVSEKKQLFKEYIQQQKKQERNEVRNRLEMARENFLKMLEENKTLTSDAKFYKSAHMFVNDPRYKALDERDRESCFQDYLDRLYDQEKESKRQQKKDLSERLRNMLAADDRVTVATKWDDVCELYKEDDVWETLNEYDRLTVFADYVINIEKNEAEERRKNRKTQERLNREGFREMLNEYEEKGQMSYKSKWKNFLQLIKDEERFLNLLGQGGSTSHELFEDKMEILRENHKKFKDDIKQVLKQTGLKMSTKTTKEEFLGALKDKDELKEVSESKREAFYKYFTEKAASKEKETLRKHKKSVKKFNRFLKSLKDLKPESQYKDFEAQIKEGLSNFPGLLSEEIPKIFEEYVHELKNHDEGLISEDDDAAKKKRKKAKRKKTKRKDSDDSDAEDRDRSGDDSDSKRSRSRDRSHKKKKVKKEKKRKDKKDQDDSDDEKPSRSPSPSKKVKKDTEETKPVNMIQQAAAAPVPVPQKEEEPKKAEEQKKEPQEPQQKEESKTMELETADNDKDKQIEAGEIAKEKLPPTLTDANKAEEGLIAERRDEGKYSSRKERHRRDRSASKDTSRSRSRKKKSRKESGKKSSRKDSKKHRKAKSSKKHRDDTSSSDSDDDR